MPVSEYDENIRARDVRVTNDALTVFLVDGTWRTRIPSILGRVASSKIA